MHCALYVTEKLIFSYCCGYMYSVSVHNSPRTYCVYTVRYLHTHTDTSYRRARNCSKRVAQKYTHNVFSSYALLALLSRSILFPLAHFYLPLSIFLFLFFVYSCCHILRSPSFYPTFFYPSTNPAIFGSPLFHFVFKKKWKGESCLLFRRRLPYWTYRVVYTTNVYNALEGLRGFDVKEKYKAKQNKTKPKCKSTRTERARRRRRTPQQQQQLVSFWKIYFVVSFARAWSFHLFCVHHCWLVT